MNKLITVCNHCGKQLKDEQKRMVSIERSMNEFPVFINFDVNDSKLRPHKHEKKNLKLPLHWCNAECFTNFFLGESYLKDINND
jgi:hypothetical protein